MTVTYIYNYIEIGIEKYKQSYSLQHNKISYAIDWIGLFKSQLVEVQEMLHIYKMLYKSSPVFFFFYSINKTL